MDIMQYNKTKLNVPSVLQGETMKETAGQHYSECNNTFDMVGFNTLNLQAKSVLFKTHS